MFFTRTQKFELNPITRDEFRSRLIGKHVKIHDLDFEVYESEYDIKIIPHSEMLSEIKTLPITDVKLSKKGNKTYVEVTSKMRNLDSGGPRLLLVLCAFLIIAAVILLLFSSESRQLSYSLLGIGVCLFLVYYAYLQIGYFDIARRVSAYVKSTIH